MFAKVTFKAVTVTLLLVIGQGLSATVVNADDLSERIAPVGSTCLQGDDCAKAVAATSSSARSTDSIYNTSCMACHATGAAGAPKLGDKAAWQARLAQGLEPVYANAINGINAMPARGGCADCSDEEIKAVVDYMVDSVK